MITARSANKAYLAIILTVAALVFPLNIRAASGNIQICQSNTSCTIGEFLYNDSYSPLTSATCNITSRYPNGTLLLNNLNMPVSSQGDGWYAHTFTAPSILGLYRTEVKCTAGTEVLALDKSFEVQSPPPPPAAIPTANDVAAAVWGYSGRTLTSFGSLVSDIWGNTTRTLSDSTSSDISTVKTDVSSIKSKVETVATDISSLKGTSSTTNITNIQNTTNTTNNLLEQLINRPTTENVLEESSFTFTELQTKIEKSDSVANQLLTSSTYIKSKNNLIKEQWNNLGESEITKSLDQMNSVIGEESDKEDKKSLFGAIAWIQKQWNLPISPKLYAQNKKLALSLKSAKEELSSKGKVKSANSKLAGLSLNLNNFVKLIGQTDDSPKLNTLFGELKVQKELLSSLDKNYFEATTLLSDFKGNSKPQADLVTKINTLGIQIAKLNQLPEINKILLTKSDAKMDQKQLKNQTLSLRGIIEANRQLLAQNPNQPLKSLWLEEGSIVFKTLISNPSTSISQKVPLKYYLPKEVTRDNIIKTDDDLNVNYDAEKDQYFISGQFTLAARETKTLSVTVDDSAFHISDQEIATIRKQTEELSKPLNATSYFAQGVTLKSDINASLDKIEILQKDALTPEAKIRGFREAQIEIKAANLKLEKLKDIAIAAGSAGNLFGFVGGAQAIAVWGLIIIMTAGFVFLALYMRTLKKNESHSELTPFVDRYENYEEVPNKETALHTPSKKKFHTRKAFKYSAVLVVILLIGGSSIYALGSLKQGKQNAVPAPAQTVLGSSTQKTASESAKLDPSLYKEVNILVPVDSTVTIHSEPTVNSPVLTALKASKRAKEIKRQDGWVKILLEDSEDQKQTEGWVDEDFVEVKGKLSEIGTESDTKVSQEGIAVESKRTITVSDTPTGFLRVRKTPGGEEITKINPGEQFIAPKESAGWVNIILEDGTSGWVSKQYVIAG